MMLNREVNNWPILGKIGRNVDWVLFFASALLVSAGLVTMHSFVGPSPFFERQLVWISVGLVLFFAFSIIDWRFLRRTGVIVSLFTVMVAALLLLFLFGTVTKGALSRFDLGVLFVQPTEIAKIVLILVLSKYFSRRHIEIAHVRHILVSGFYAFVLFFLVFIQPDLGSAIIIFLIWFGMVLVSGISKQHLLAVFLVGALSFVLLWSFAFQDYQKERILTFLNPLEDIQGAGYSAYQSTIAVGSGQIFGKGVGFGTQSRLRFLPEYETDFIFAAFSEEWGFVGNLILFALFGVVIWRIVANALLGATNFEILYGLGLSILFVSHFILHVGINVGLLPVTGTTLPLVSYGGSHLAMEFMGLGILMGMRGYRSAVHRDDAKKEFLGPR